MELLSLPLSIRDGYLGRTSLDKSIIYSIGLILGTPIGSLPFAPDFGCNIWDRAFSDLPTSNKASIQTSLRHALERFERRLYNVSVSFTIPDQSAPHTLGIVVRVTGNYMDGDDEKKLETNFTIG